SCGTAFTLSQTFIDNPQFNFAGNAFNVVDNDCAVGNLSFPHELGHNFGLAHDRFVSPNATPSRPYAFGFVDTQGQFRDIMAYPDACNFCPRIQFFSSPSLSFLGRPLGISFESSPSTSAENVRALNNNASIIANWRQAIAAPPTPTFTDNPLVAGTTPVKALHITELRTAIDDYREFAGLTTFAWSANVAVDSLIAAAQIAELRNALEPALVAEGRTATFANPLAVDDAIAAIDVQELRDLLSSD
ncbi:MAG TPA: hypothetical protein VG106_11950, partial [Vicinamibacterales bacterium]|nr:hypothetical protein [Vicinamibacterales bacterium]